MRIRFGGLFEIAVTAPPLSRPARTSIPASNSSQLSRRFGERLEEGTGSFLDDFGAGRRKCHANDMTTALGFYFDQPAG